MRTGCVGGSGAHLGGGYRTEEREDRGSHRHLPPLFPPPPFPPFLELQLPTPSCGLRLTHVLSFPLPRSLGHSREKLRYEMHPAWFDGSLGPPVRIRQMISLPKPRFLGVMKRKQASDGSLYVSMACHWPLKTHTARSFSGYGSPYPSSLTLPTLPTPEGTQCLGSGLLTQRGFWNRTSGAAASRTGRAQEQPQDGLCPCSSGDGCSLLSEVALELC